MRLTSLILSALFVSLSASGAPHHLEGAFSGEPYLDLTTVERGWKHHSHSGAPNPRRIFVAGNLQRFVALLRREIHSFRFYGVISSSTVTGPYTDAGVTFGYLSGATRIGAVPAPNVPAGSSAFFRLLKP